MFGRGRRPEEWGGSELDAQFGSLGKQVGSCDWGRDGGWDNKGGETLERFMLGKVSVTRSRVSSILNHSFRHRLD